jgi:hypothetical protein
MLSGKGGRGQSQTMKGEWEGEGSWEGSWEVLYNTLAHWPIQYGGRGEGGNGWFSCGATLQL